MRPIVWRGTVTRAISRARRLRNLIKEAAAGPGRRFSISFFSFMRQMTERSTLATESVFGMGREKSTRPDTNNHQFRFLDINGSR
jgi:hypothetical protein